MLVAPNQQTSHQSQVSRQYYGWQIHFLTVSTITISVPGERFVVKCLVYGFLEIRVPLGVCITYLPQSAHVYLNVFAMPPSREAVRRLISPWETSLWAKNPSIFIHPQRTL